MWDACDPYSGPSTCKTTNNQSEMTDLQRFMKMAQNKENNTIRIHLIPSYSLLRSYKDLCLQHITIERRILRQTHTHICTHLGNEKSSVKTWIRIWWAHRERWNASACSVPAQCKQPVHVCACLPSSKAAFHFPLVPISPHSDFCSASYHRCNPTTGFHTQTQHPDPLPAARPSHSPAVLTIML